VHQIHREVEEGRYRECNFRRVPEAWHFDLRCVVV
jgi:hypothetical protein